MLRHKKLQDLKKNKWQFISILLMAFLGVYIFTGVGGEWAGVENFRTKYYSETNLADGWIYGEGFSNDDLKAVQSIDGVTQAEKRCYLQIEGADDAAPQIYFYGLNENSINKPYVVDGEEFSTTANDKVWIAKQFADAKGLKVGDEYTFKFDSTEFSLKIAGLVYSSEYQYFSNENDLWPDYNNIGFAYASVNALPIKQYIIDTVSSDKYTVSELVDEFAKEYPEIADNADMLKGMSKESIVKFLKLAKDDEFKDAIPYTQIVFTSSKPAKNLADEIESKLSGNYAAFVTRAENSGITMLDSEMAQHKMIGSVFPIVFMLIALLAIITSMNRLISNQRIQIGTLKALGFSSGKIALHYTGYGFSVSLIGSLLGLIAGPLTLPYLFYGTMATYYSLPQWKTGYDASFFLVALGTVAACTLVTFLTVKSILKESPAQSLRPKAPKDMKATSAAKTKTWRKTSFNLKWTLRDIFRGKIRTVMGIVGTISCMALLVCAFSMYDCMNDMETWMYGEIQVQDTRLTLYSTATIDDAEEIAADVDGEMIMSTAIEAEANGVKKTETVTAVDGSGCYYLTDPSRKQIEPTDDTFAITKKLADALGVSEGDEIRWHLYTSDKWVTSKITNIVRNPSTQGIIITRSTLESLGYDYMPQYIDTTQHITEYDNPQVAKLLSQSDLHNFWDNYMESMNMMVSIIILFAVTLAVVVLYNLGQLSYTEKEREIATLKVLGFPTGKIIKLNLIPNIIFSIIGIIFGTPAGLGLTYIMIASAGDEFDMMTKLSFPSFLISALITLGVSVMTGLIFTGRVKKLDMVSSLKGVE